ncbi:aspartyl-phosphate phosphatase Spo0E family protein [Marinicrinis sediminis]|uniref:Aspartyl-phosphate phosphatase Spo0E family protein n=1 Tax=Marinicrinis sediminis TaxID=1652465 RepID=A0ABW5R5F7_9BACL
MTKQIGLQKRIKCLKLQLEDTAQKHAYDFMHPEVLSISQELDGLIIQAMREKNVESSTSSNSYV